MTDVYRQVVEHLKAYRKEMNIRQEEMGQLMGVNQSHYCKFESGASVISYRSLEVLLENRLDVDYLVTGVHSATSVLDQLMEACPKAEQSDLLELIFWTVNQGMKTLGEDVSEQDFRDIEILRQYTHTNQPIWYVLRSVNHLTQEEMAGRLKMNIKRYRRMEKGETLADAMDFAVLYQNLSYPPSLIISGKAYVLSKINEIWNRFHPEVAKMLYHYLEEGITIMRRAIPEPEKTEIS